MRTQPPRVVLVTIVVILSVFAALLHPAPVFAQGEEPPAPAPAGETSQEETTPQEDNDPPPAGEEQPVAPEEPAAGNENGPETPVVEAPEPGAPATPPGEPNNDPAPTGAETPPGAPAPGGDTPPLASTADPLVPISEVVEALAETQTVLTDAQGNPLPLASEAAALALSEPDPYFSCSNDSADGTNDGVCHYNGAGGIIEALADFTNRGGSGMITVENGTFTGGLFINNIANLTGLTGAGIGASTINGSIDIQNMAGNFTLQGFTINGSVTARGGSGLFTASNLDITAFGDGLNIAQAGDILVQNVDASNNKDRGAYLNAAKVTVRNSTFLGNGDGNDNALEIDAGAVTLDKVQVKNNGGTGAQIYFGANLTVTESDFWNNASTTDGMGYGLRAENTLGQGNIQINGSGFQQNTLAGAYLYTRKGNITVASSANKASEFTGNGAGLRAETLNGSVNLQNILTKDNLGGHGAEVIQGGVGTVLVNSSSFIRSSFSGLTVNASGDVTVTGLNQQTIVSQNSTGLIVTSSGKITLNNVSSTTNSNAGIGLDNLGGAKDVSLTNVISGNNGVGIDVNTHGAITFNQVYASRNSSYGANLVSAPATGMKAVTITNSDFNSNVSGSGLTVQARGLITVNNLGASGNGGAAASLKNDFSGVTAGVTILGTMGDNLINNNSGTGLQILTNGPLSITDLLASGNNGIGLRASVGGAVTLKQVAVEKTMGQGIDISGLNTITLTGVTATNNTGPGIALSNSTATLPKAITLTNVNANANLNVGLTVNATGQLTLNNISALGNAGPGASLINTSGAVNITNGFFDFNNAPGLGISTPGALTLKTVSASGNTGGGGLIISNGTNLNITEGSFDRNSGPGLQAIDLTGTITLNTVTANRNSAIGAYLSNSNATLAKNVTINNAQFDSNNGPGLQAQSKGLFSLTGVSGSGNTSAGLLLTNDLAGATAGITLTNVRTDNNTFGPGTNLQTSGTVTLNALSANNNSLGGLTGSTGNLTITKSAFTGNGGAAGIALNVNGVVTLNTIVASNNTAGGANITNSSNITITKSSFDRNGSGAGLSLTSDGAITLNTVNANYNTVGASLTATAAGKITLTGTQFNRNYGPGLTAISNSGVITATNISASNNLDTGALFQNDAGGTTNGITLTNGVFDQNTGIGVGFLSNGAILNTQVSANGNTNGMMITTSGSYTLSKGSFNSNMGVGISVGAAGVISVSTISATRNGVHGSIFSNVGGAISNLSITKGDFSSNGGNGLITTADGNITLNGITANANSGTGMIADATPGAGTITLLGTANYASNNTDQGLRLTADNQIIINNTFANGNGILADLDGAYLSTTGNSPVVIKGGSFSGNGRNGIRSETGTGTLTLRCVTAIGNDVAAGSADPNIFPTGALINTCP